jgi:hypothetical protein
VEEMTALLIADRHSARNADTGFTVVARSAGT